MYIDFFGKGRYRSNVVLVCARASVCNSRTATSIINENTSRVFRLNRGFAVRSGLRIGTIAVNTVPVPWFNDVREQTRIVQ